MRRVNSLNDLAERAAMLAPFGDATTAAAASASVSSPSSSAASSPVLYAPGLSPLASLASASSAIDLLRTTATTQQDMSPVSASRSSRASQAAVTSPAETRDKKRKREATAPAEHHAHHRHVALRPSVPASPSAAKQAQAQRAVHHASNGNGHAVGHSGHGHGKPATSNGAPLHRSDGGAGAGSISSIPRSTSAPSLAHMPSPAPLSPRMNPSSSSSSPSSSSPPSPVHSAQISPSSIHLRDFTDTTKHLLTVMCATAGGDATKAAPGWASELRLGFGAVVQPVEKASAYWFAEVPSVYEVLSATGLWQRAFLMEVLCQERHLVVDRTLYCGYKRVSQDKFTFYFDSDSETLRQLYAHATAATAATAGPASPASFPFASGGVSGSGGSSGIPFRFSPGMSLPAPAAATGASGGPRSYATSPVVMTSSTSNGSTGTGHHHLSTSSPASSSSASSVSTLSSGRHHASIPRTTSHPALASLAADGPRLVTVDRRHSSSESEQHNHGAGCCVKEEDEESDGDGDDGFYQLRAANANDDCSTEEGESFEQPPAKLFLLTEYCYFDPTVLKKRSIRCIPCKMSLSKMGWKQHMLSTVHVEKKAKFNARGQSPQQTAELVYRSAGGGLTCLACAVLLPPGDFDRHVAGAMHAKKRKEWAMLDHIERWSDILSKKPRYSTATPLSPTLTGPALVSSPTTTISSSVGSSGANAAAELQRSTPAAAEGQLEQAGSEQLAELFYVECYPMTPVTGYTQWVALHSTRNWDARNFEVLITSRGKQDRLVVEPLSWKTTTARGFLFNLAVKFERTYGPDPVQLCLVIRDTMGASAQGHEQEIQIPLGRAIVCSNSSQRLKRLQQLGEESALTDTEQRVIPHYTQCALVHKGREHRYRVKPLSTVLAAAVTATTIASAATAAVARAPSPTSQAPLPTTAQRVVATALKPLAASSPANMTSSLPALAAAPPSSSSSSSSATSLLASALSGSSLSLYAPPTATATSAAAATPEVTPSTSALHRRPPSHHQQPFGSPQLLPSPSPAPRPSLIVKTSS